MFWSLRFQIKADILAPDIEGFGGEYPMNLPKNETSPVNLTLKPKENQNGTVVITLTVTDMKEADKKDSKTMYVTVKPVNDPPVIQELPVSVEIEEYEPADVIFKISDIEGGTMNLEITSDNETLFPLNTEHISLVNYSTVLSQNETRTLTLKLTPARKRVRGGKSDSDFKRRGACSGYKGYQGNSPVCQ